LSPTSPNSFIIPSHYFENCEIINDNRYINRNNYHHSPSPSPEIPSHNSSQSLPNSPLISPSQLPENAEQSLIEYNPSLNVIKHLLNKFENSDLSKVNKTELYVYNRNMNKLMDNLEHSELTTLFKGEDKLFNAMVFHDKVKNLNITVSDLFKKK